MTGAACPKLWPTHGRATPSSSGSWIASLKHLVDTVAGLHCRNVGFQSLQEQIDTTTSGGKLIFHVYAALAEFDAISFASARPPGSQQRGRVAPMAVVPPN
jgi:hypothetical protein